MVECFDMRRKSSVGRINTAVSPEDFNQVLHCGVANCYIFDVILGVLML